MASLLALDSWCSHVGLSKMFTWVRHLGTVDIWGGGFFVVGTVLPIVACSAASMAAIH